MPVFWTLLLAPLIASASFAQEVEPTLAPERPPAGLSRSEPPPADPSPMPRPEAPSESGRPEPGWTLRAVPDGSRLALAGGVGRVTSLAAFCLGGAPWLALKIAPPTDVSSLSAGFGFSGAQIEVEALREAGAGDAYMIELAEGPLAGLLAGGDVQATLSIGGTQQGILSLAGSSEALNGALAPCHSL